MYFGKLRINIKWKKYCKYCLNRLLYEKVSYLINLIHLNTRAWHTSTRFETRLLQQKKREKEIKLGLHWKILKIVFFQYFLRGRWFNNWRSKTFTLSFSATCNRGTVPSFNQIVESHGWRHWSGVARCWHWNVNYTAFQYFTSGVFS